MEIPHDEIGLSAGKAAHHQKPGPAFNCRAASTFVGPGGADRHEEPKLTHRQHICPEL